MERGETTLGAIGACKLSNAPHPLGTDAFFVLSFASSGSGRKPNWRGGVVAFFLDKKCSLSIFSLVNKSLLGPLGLTTRGGENVVVGASSFFSVL